jgi:lipoprotein signal peptidase
MTNVELQIQKHHSAWIYLLPSLHLCASAGIAFSKLTAGLLYLSYIDFPLSAILLWMTFRTGHPMICFGILGTLWWYLLSLVGLWFINRFIVEPWRI